jgi:hypothetical protein
VTIIAPAGLTRRPVDTALSFAVERDGPCRDDADHPPAKGGVVAYHYTARVKRGCAFRDGISGLHG